MASEPSGFSPRDCGRAFIYGLLLASLLIHLPLISHYKPSSVLDVHVHGCWSALFCTIAETPELGEILVPSDALLPLTLYLPPITEIQTKVASQVPSAKCQEPRNVLLSGSGAVSTCTYPPFSQLVNPLTLLASLLIPHHSIHTHSSSRRHGKSEQLRSIKLG